MNVDAPFSSSNANFSVSLWSWWFFRMSVPCTSVSRLRPMNILLLTLCSSAANQLQCRMERQKGFVCLHVPIIVEFEAFHGEFYLQLEGVQTVLINFLNDNRLKSACTNFFLPSFPWAKTIIAILLLLRLREKPVPPNPWPPSFVILCSLPRTA